VNIIHTRVLWWWIFHASNRPCFVHDITGWFVRFLWLLCYGGAACAHYYGLWATYICICVYEWTSLYHPLYCYTSDRVQNVGVLYLCSEMMQLVASERFTISFAFVTFTAFYNIICICYFHTFKVQVQQQKTRTWPAPRYININWW